VDDLNEEREKIRNNLIDKCLEVINAHGEVTFEVAELISTVVSKSPDPSEQVCSSLFQLLLFFSSQPSIL
jgi:E3 ubiquitin-protein ligase HUWE1